MTQRSSLSASATLPPAQNENHMRNILKKQTQKGAMSSDVENAKRGFDLGRDASKKAKLSEGTSPEPKPSH